MTGVRTAVLLIVSLSSSTAAISSAASSAAPKKIRWESSFPAALKKAKAEKKPVMIDFWAEWCGWCFELEKKTYREPEVLKRAQGMIAVKVDTEGSRSEVQLAREYRVESLPTIAFVSPHGRPIVRVNGFQDGPQLARVMDQVASKAAEVLAWEAALEANASDATALAKLGGHLFDAEYYEDAQALLRRAADADKERPSKERKRTRTLLGIILHFAGKPPEAEATLKEALALEPADAEEDPAALFTLAKVHIKTGKNGDARAILQKLVEKHPDSRPAARARETLETLPAK